MFSNKIFKSLLVLLVVVFATYAIYWYWAALQIVSTLDRDIARLQQEGYDIRYETQQTSGFPTRLKLKVRNLVVYPSAVENPPKLLEVEQFSFVTKVVNPITFLKERMSSEEETLDLASLDVMTFSAKNIQFLQGAMAPMPDQIGNVYIAASATGMMPFTGSSEEKVSHWQQSQGKILVHEAAMEWGELFMNSNGLLALDEKMQVAGQLKTVTAGFPQFLKQLGQKGFLDSRTAVLAAEGISFFAKPIQVEGQTRDYISVPVSFDQGDLKLGPISLMEIGPVF